MNCFLCKWCGKAYMLDKFGKPKKAIYGWCTNSDISEWYKGKVREEKVKGCMAFADMEGEE